MMYSNGRFVDPGLKFYIQEQQGTVSSHTSHVSVARDLLIAGVTSAISTVGPSKPISGGSDSAKGCCKSTMHQLAATCNNTNAYVVPQATNWLTFGAISIYPQQFLRKNGARCTWWCTWCIRKRNTWNKQNWHSSWPSTCAMNLQVFDADENADPVWKNSKVLGPHHGPQSHGSAGCFW